MQVIAELKHCWRYMSSVAIKTVILHHLLEGGDVELDLLIEILFGPNYVKNLVQHIKQAVQDTTFCL